MNYTLKDFLVIICIIGLFVIFAINTDLITSKNNSITDDDIKSIQTTTSQEIENFLNKPEPFYEDNNSDEKPPMNLDEDGCYKATFSLCNRVDDRMGYKIFSSAQNKCEFPDKNAVSGFETAFSVVDKYLNLTPDEIQDTCINKPAVKDGLHKFGLCNKKQLLQRHNDLVNQKELIANLNNTIEEHHLDTGINHMKLIYKSCFNEDLAE